MTIGETLKRARTKLGLDLDDVTRDTKIAKMFLIALENDDISSLPQGVYTRNFLRTYARYLKLDEDILTTEYHEQYSIKPHYVHQLEQTKADNRVFVERRNKRLIVVFFLIAVPVGLGVLYWKMREPINELLSGVISAGTELPAAKPPTPVGLEPPAKTSEDSNQPPESALIVDEQEPSSAEDQETTEPSDESSDDLSPADAQPADADEPGAETGSDSSSETLDESAAPAPDDASTEATLAEGERETTSPADQPLPISSLEGLTFYPTEREPASLAETFSIEGLDESVWVEVIIDGIDVTKRLLRKGQVRHYIYGQSQTVILGDARAVAAQDGTAYREFAHDRRIYVKVEDFGPGEFFSALDAAVTSELARLAEERAKEDEQE